MARSVYTVTQVNTYIKNMFTQDYMLQSLFVKGEVSNCKYHSSGHIYFTLKDSKGTMNCVMFAGNRSGLKFQMAEGQQVIVFGTVDVYERDGKYQMYARQIALDGAGALYERYEKLKQELEELGMFAKEYKQPIPRFIKTLGVVTADTGAAVRDIIQIASRRNPYGTLTVPFEAFHDCKGLTEITLPASLISTEYEQFKGCTGLIGVTLKDGFDYIGSRSFADCKSLNYIIIPDSVTHIGYASFYNTAYYNDYKNWEDGVLYIGNHLIEFSSAVSEYEIKKGTLTVASDAFLNNTVIESVIFPDSVRFISLHAFDRCKNLKSIRLSESLKSIDYAAFWDCESLESLSIPKSVEYIAEEAFGKCSKLANVYFEDISGWKAGDVIIKPSELANSESAALLLSTEHSRYDWSRSETGNMDGKGEVDANDAIYLLYNVFFGDENYPLNQSCDFDANGDVNANDAIYLLYHVFFGKEEYPLI